MLTTWDKALFDLINGGAGQWPAVDAAARLLVNDYLLPSTLAFLLVWIWLRSASPRGRSVDTGIVINAVVAQFAANMVLKLVNLAYFRPRPFDPDPTVHLLFYRPWDSSCPSNPAAFGFAIATAIYLGDRRLGKAALVVAAIWALARVFSGVHYPLDVAAGAALGGGMAYWVSQRSAAAAWLRERLYHLLQKGLVA